MGLLDYIRERLNPEIIRQYDDLLDNHGEALRLYCRGGYKDPKHHDWRPRRNGYPLPERAIPFKWKKKLVEEKEQLLNWYIEENEYLKGCAYAKSHPYGLTIALRKKRIMPKDAPMPHLPEWKRLADDAPFSLGQTMSRVIPSPYRQIPFSAVSGSVYKTIEWNKVERQDAEARERLNRIEHITKWRAEQNSFATKCYRLMQEKFSGWGCYFYDVPFPTADEKEASTASVRQVFFQSFCDDTKLDYTHYGHCAQNRQTVSSFVRLESSYTDKYVRPLIDYILALDKDANGGLTVILGDSGVSNSAPFNDYHLQYLVNEIEEHLIPVVQFDDIKKHFNGIPIGKVLVVVEVITDNNHLKNVCSTLFKDCYEEAPLIVYVTLLKGYSSDEMQSLIDAKKKEIEERERKKREEEEKRKKEEEEKKRKEEELRTKRMMLGAAESKDWPMVKGVHHYFFYYYYPTRFDDVTEFDWDVRNLIWNFKDGTRHDNVCQILTEKLQRVYGKALDLLTFVCIPASTREVNRNRYQAFMNDVCQATGMANGYEYVTIVKEKEPSHLGGESPAEYAYDNDFFNGRQVILFDDVVTRGRSLAKMKAELENVGAHVVAAMSIGRTYSDYYGDIREPHPWVVENQ